MGEKIASVALRKRKKKRNRKSAMTIPIKNTTLKNVIAHAVSNLTTKKTTTVTAKKMTTIIINTLTMITTDITNLNS